MKALNLSYSCEIGNLIDVMAEHMNKSIADVEKMAEKEYLFPESGKVFVTTQFGKDKRSGAGTLRGSLFDFMVENKIESMYITLSI